MDNRNDHFDRRPESTEPSAHRSQDSRPELPNGHFFNAYPARSRLEEDDTSSIDSIRRGIRERDHPKDAGIVTDAPKFRLGYVDVICLIVNRMIGSGIFMTPHKVMMGTHSTGASLLFWFAGIVYALAGMHVYIEYGLSVPRIVYNRVEQSVPQSGGDFNYLRYVYRWVGYRGQTVLYISCLFGISFVVLGNTAGNCINFAIWVMRAAGTPASEGAIRGIALAIATFSCCIHAFSRRGGILLNDVLALIKVLILLLIIVTAIIVAANGKQILGTSDVFTDNMNTHDAFEDASHDAHGYATAFLAIIFAFSGFEQPNYVLGEIARPRKKFPISMIVGTTFVCVLYMATNMSYMAVVPKCIQTSASSSVSVAEQFFNLTYSGYSYDASSSCASMQLIAPAAQNNTGYRIFSAFVAISSFGNVVVMTFTSARVKQEIFKQGILPNLKWAKILAHDRDLSIGRLLKWLQNRGWFRSILKHRWFSPEEHSEKTPVGALMLHEISCVILLVATFGLTAQDAYTLLSSLSAYVINAVFGVLLSLGILILRFHGPPATSPETAGKSWTAMTGKAIRPWLSITSAAIYLIGNLWPVVNLWIPPATTIASGLSWFVIPSVSCCILALGSLWFFGFLIYAKRRESKKYEVYTVERSPQFDFADGAEWHNESGVDGGLILEHETVYLAWTGKEFMEKVDVRPPV